MNNIKSGETMAMGRALRSRAVAASSMKGVLLLLSLARHPSHAVEPRCEKSVGISGFLFK